MLSITLTNGYNTNNGSTPRTPGGAIVMDSGSLIMFNCTLSGNGCAGDGGAIYDLGDSLSLINCTLSGNYSEGIGGAVVAFTGSSVLISNCTLSGNSSYDGGSAIGNNGSTLIMTDSTVASNFPADGSPASGGGIYINDGPVTLYNCTVSGNTSGIEGGGIFNNIGTLVMTNTILAGNVASSNQDIVGSYSGGNNFVGGNPELAPLANYGGPTQTMRPIYGSPVVDTGSDSVASFIPEDQRGYQRLYGAHVDIGAVEAEYAPTNRAVVKIGSRATNECEIAFTNVPNVNYIALTSTNLALPLTDWTQLGYAIQISSGQYQFTDTSATNRMQFYDVVSESE